MSFVLIIICVASLLYLLKKKYQVFLLGWRIPGPWSIPLIGNVQMMTRISPENLYETFNKNRGKYGETYRLWLGPQLWVFLHSPEETRAALNDSSLIKAETFNQLSVLIGNGLLLSHGKHWEAHRRALGPAFAPQILNTFYEAIQSHASKLVQRINNVNQTQSNPIIEMDEFIFPCVLDIIIDTSMGKNVQAQNDPHCIYTHTFHRISALLYKRMTNPLLAPDFIFNKTSMAKELYEHIETVYNLVDTVIKDRSEYLKENLANVNLNRKKRTLLDTLLTAEINGAPLTTQAIRDEVNTFMLAGVDTTNAAMGFVLFALGKYTDEQDIIFNEIQMRKNSPEDELSLEDVNNMEHLDMFLKECLRLYTIVPVSGRETTRDTVIGNRKYCAGVTLWVNFYGLAHDPEFFENPYEFRPERFTKEAMEKLPPFSYIPFSGGPHVCIGRRYAFLIMKVLVVKLLENFEICLGNPNEELILMAQMVLKSKNGINLKFKPRNPIS